MFCFKDGAIYPDRIKAGTYSKGNILKNLGSSEWYMCVDNSVVGKGDARNVNKFRCTGSWSSTTHFWKCATNNTDIFKTYSAYSYSKTRDTVKKGDIIQARFGSSSSKYNLHNMIVTNKWTNSDGSVSIRICSHTNNRKNYSFYTLSSNLHKSNNYVTYNIIRVR